MRRKALGALAKLTCKYGSEDPRVATKQRGFPTVFILTAQPDNDALPTTQFQAQSSGVVE